MSTKALTTRFDPIFAQYGHGLPVPFLRALAQRESGLNPAGTHGLISVVQVVRQDYNQKHGTSYTQADMQDPAVNVTLATDDLMKVVTAYKKHPSKNMHVDWANPEFVLLLTAGWNSGHSEGSGVGHVVSYLERHGLPVTHDNVFAYAAEAGGTRHLQNAAKRTWQKTVANLYFAQPDALRTFSGSGMLTLALAAFVAWGAYHLWGKSR
jgi:hypothetical protein